MTFTRLVEVGRIALINFGEDTGKLCTVVEIVDMNKVLVDGPAKETGVTRKVIPLKQLRLTDLKVSITRHAREKQLLSAWKKADIKAKWGATAWGKKVAARAAKKTATDLDRFKATLAKQKISKALKARLAKA